jgi:hypothetical protein
VADQLLKISDIFHQHRNARNNVEYNCKIYFTMQIIRMADIISNTQREGMAFPTKVEYVIFSIKM